MRSPPMSGERIKVKNSPIRSFLPPSTTKDHPLREVVPLQSQNPLLSLLARTIMADPQSKTFPLAEAQLNNQVFLSFVLRPYPLMP